MKGRVTGAHFTPDQLYLLRTSLDSRLALRVDQAVLQQESVLEEVCWTLCTAVLGLQDTGDRHVVVLEVGQQEVVHSKSGNWILANRHVHKGPHLSPQRLHRKRRWAEE